jgi:hypothetical protein
LGEGEIERRRAGERERKGDEGVVLGRAVLEVLGRHYLGKKQVLEISFFKLL